MVWRWRWAGEARGGCWSATGRSVLLDIQRHTHSVPVICSQARLVLFPAYSSSLSFPSSPRSASPTSECLPPPSSSRALVGTSSCRAAMSALACVRGGGGGEVWWCYIMAESCGLLLRWQVVRQPRKIRQ